MSTLPRAPACDYKRRVPRVLIPSDNPDFAHYLAQAYRRAGWDAVVGVGNFELACAAYDLVHFQWPEELCGWRPPSDPRLEEVLARLDKWTRSAKVAMTVHNLHPHREAAHANYRRLYEGFVARVPVFAHFTETSRELMLREYPDASRARHVVTGYFNLDHLVPAGWGIEARRGDGFVLMVFGGLREWAEVELLREAFDRARVPGKRLLMCGRYDEPGSVWQQRWRRWDLARWLRARESDVRRERIPDAELHRAVAAADAVVIPRFQALNSGLPALGASFGKIVIAPRCGAYPELLAGTPNPIYAPGDAADLARAIEQAAALDRVALCEGNRQLAQSWSWDHMVQLVINTTAGAKA